ncbi:isocitrate/isopropylmalate family dehydrogenase [Bacillus velezensis]|nr:isocitrate/isopropylmalate family dehydrogenase [Bacillus velezensis]MEC2278766.1 isocitrate/isopropylmalate family dehydrogenase [Bacillus velezensis]MEC2310901.1 isocitrate/isopropylmalate family dehydrogenase [Bacillus velezensis]CDG30515.1 conserved protein of unknown function [Bacillus velezensis UCMB5033]
MSEKQLPPAKTIPGMKSIAGKANLVIYRENTEGFYAGRNMYIGLGEWQVTPEVAVLTGVFTKKAITRIAHAAFQSAMERRKKVTWLGTLFEYVPRNAGTIP